MIKKIDRNEIRKSRHQRIRNHVSGTAERPRLDVYRSLKHIYVQVIDDVAAKTLAAASTVEAEIKRAMEKGISEVVFDRGGYVYTGRVAEVADGARSAGLKL